MPLFDVRLGRVFYQRATVEVEADTALAAEAEALELASEIVWEDRESDGPYVERVEERR